ncbi:MAG: hypothetical protein AB7U83_18990 [Vicinamibacterales bacterium]
MSGPAGRRRAGAGCAAALVALALAATAAGQPPASPPRTLVVPFALEKFDPRVAWLGEGTAIGITAALAGRGVVVVEREERLDVFERLQLPPAASLTRATIIKVAELVGASRVIVGRVGLSGTNVAIEAQVLHVDSARLDAPLRIETPVGGLLDAYRDLAARAAPGPAAVAPSPPLAPSVPAFELYVRGLTAVAADAQERFLVQAIATAPGYVDARLALWSARTARGAHDEAVVALADVPATGPHALDLGIRRGASLLHLRRYDDAFAVLKEHTATVPSPVAANLLGVVQLRRGSTPQTGRATYFFHQAAELDPDDPDYCFNLGYAYWLEKDAMAAAYWLREAVRRDPTDGDAHFVLAAALAASGAGTEAERERELARRLSARWEASGGDAAPPRGLERVKDRASAAQSPVETRLLAGAQRDQREAAAFHLETAERAYAAGRDPETIREVQRALYLAPYDAGANLLLGRALARSGLLHEAVDAVKIAIWSAESPEGHLVLGDVLLRLRDVDGAGRAADRALALAPDSAAAAALAARVRAARSGGA